MKFKAVDKVKVKENFWEMSMLLTLRLRNKYMKFNFTKYEANNRQKFIGITHLRNGISLSRQATQFLGANEFVTIKFDRQNKAIKLTPNNHTGTIIIRKGVDTRFNAKIPDMPYVRYIQSEKDESIFIYQ